MDNAAAIPNFDRGTEGLLPAIAQDAETGQVLMLAWMNREAWQETLASGKAVYFSRSRGKLWRKGEQSGHQQVVCDIRVDCDADTILLQVKQKGAACHEGYRSCFFRKVEPAGTGADQEIRVAVADERLKSPEEIYGAQDS